jgi:hypothetical protein
MDFITREQARQDIIALGLPQIILDAFDGKPLPYRLANQFREPYEILCLDPTEQADYGQGRITPIWGDGYTIVAYHHAPARRGFFRFNIESDGEGREPVGLNWQQILVEEFRFLWQFERTYERLSEIANCLDFKHIDLFIDELSSSGRDPFEEAWYRSFLERIAD